jgi:peptide/nickel transport system substrate-binding protein
MARKTLVVAAALAAALGAAGGGDAMAAGKALVVGLVAEPTSMDPGQLTDINSMRVLSSVYDTLVRFKEGSFTQEPGLATAWKMSPDGLTYTFTLRRNVKFHDGTPFDADAVKFTYDRLLDSKHPFAETGPFPFASFYYGAIKEVAVVDPGTVRFTLKQPFSPLLNNLTLNTGRIVSPAAVKKYGKEFASHPVGTGPFKFVSWDKNVRIILEANPAYWAGPPKLERIVFRPLVEEQTRVTELLALGWGGLHRGRAARQRGPGEEGGHAHVLRAAGPSHLVGHPQHREEALQRRAGASGGQPRGEPRRDRR